MVALKSFRPSINGGVDGLRPGHLKDLAAPQTAESGRRLLKALANLCSKLLRGQISKHARDIRRIIPMLSDIGHEVNPTKSEVSNVSCGNFQSILFAIESALPGVTVTERDDLSILGAPMETNGCRTGVPKAVERFTTMSSRVEYIDAHHAFFLLWNCLSMPRLLF